MKVIVTCNQPIDQVRRLANFSSGELGIHLSNQLARAGFEVFGLKGSGATHPGPGQQCHVRLFATNDDLLEWPAQTSAGRDISGLSRRRALRRPSEARGR